MLLSDTVLQLIILRQLIIQAMSEEINIMSICAVTEARYILIMMRKQENIQTEATGDILLRTAVQRQMII